MALRLLGQRAARRGAVGRFSTAAAATERSGKVDIFPGNQLQFHHVQFYVDHLRPLSEYKALEAQLNALGGGVTSDDLSRLQPFVERWHKVAHSPKAPGDFSSFGAEVVGQMLIGAGWRVCAAHSGAETESVLVHSPDPRGVRFIITAPKDTADASAAAPGAEPYDHFAKAHIDRFLACHAGRPGAAVLAFGAEAGGVTAIHAAYAEKHPGLLLGPPRLYPAADGNEMTHVLEVFAYYHPEQAGVADEGTVLRFVEGGGGATGGAVLPGLTKFTDPHHQPRFVDEHVVCAYSDHWVSNVVDRTGFLQTLEDTLGFVPKVDFNAGVVAAGEAIIESTVTGNTPGVEIDGPEAMLVNQQQVYLPTNNALSDVGHVHLFLEQLGQGIQHLASRVPDLVAFIQRANTYREVTGGGFSFLGIPRSYYGRLALADVERVLSEHGGVAADAEAVLEALRSAGFVDVAGIVELEYEPGSLLDALETVPGAAACLPELARCVGRARYSNLYSLLREHLDEAQYLAVVKNKILVDIQGDDCLYQIFTAPILQAAPGQEAPFLEFIQRVCSAQACPTTGKPLPISPGCGGFGIRNFLTLFLSIEVSKASDALATAQQSGDIQGAETAQRMIEVFTSQLDASNPVLTAIADAMTAEAEARRRLDLAVAAGEADSAAAAQQDVERWMAQKEQGNADLAAISEAHMAMMAEIRSEHAAAA